MKPSLIFAAFSNCLSGFCFGFHKFSSPSLSVPNTDLPITLAALRTGFKIHFTHIRIWLANGAGTNLKIQATKNVGGTITPLRESFWSARRIAAGNVGTFAA